MLPRLESFARRAAYALRRRIGSDEFRIFRLQLLEFLQHPVKLDVGDFRLVEHIIEIFVPAQFFAQFLDLFGCRCVLRHAPSENRKKRAFSIQCAPVLETGCTFPGHDRGIVEVLFDTVLIDEFL